MTLTTSWQTVDSYVWTLSAGAKVTFYLDAKYSSQDKVNNKTTVNTRLRSVLNTGSVSGSGYKFTCSYATTKSGTAVWSFATETILSGSSTITHGSDGKKSVTLSATVANTYWGLSQKLSGTVDLPTIPRESTVSCSSPYIGDTAIITISKKASSFTSTVTYTIGTLTGTIATKTSATTLSLETESLKEQIYALMPNAKKTTGTITCTTYSGNTKIGSSKTATFNLYAAEDDCKPDVSGTVVDTNETTIALTGDSSKLIKHISKPKITIEATPKYSATISSYSINLNDGQTSTLQEATFNSIGSDNITVNATDSRGYNNPQTLELDMIDYVKVHIDTIDISRPEDVSSEAILNANGVWFNGNFNEETANTLAASFKYKLTGDTEWTDGGTLTPTINGNTFVFTNISLGNIYDYNNEYQFKIILSDTLMTVGSEDKEIVIVPKGIAVVEIGDELVNINGELTINDLPIGHQKVLLNIASYMHGGQSFSLSEKVSEQMLGIILVFCGYSEGAKDYNFVTYFVPKQLIALKGGMGHFIVMGGTSKGIDGFKYIYIHDDKVVGNDVNSGSHTLNGITYNNSSYCLRYVIGV